MKALADHSVLAKANICEVSGSFVLGEDGSMSIGYIPRALEHTVADGARLDAIAIQLTELLRQMPAGLVIQLVYEVEPSSPPIVAGFAAEWRRKAAERGAGAPSMLAESIAAGAVASGFRTRRLFVFISHPYAFQSPFMVRAGSAPRRFPPWSEKGFAKARKALESAAKYAEQRFASAGIPLERAADGEILGLLQRHLNPGRKLPPIVDGRGRDPAATDDEQLANPILTVAERLCCTDFSQPTPRSLSAGEWKIRAFTVCAMPEREPEAGYLRTLFSDLKGPATVSISVETLPVEGKIAALKVRRSFAQAMASVGGQRNVDAEVSLGEINDLMTAMSQKGQRLMRMGIAIAVRDLEDDALAERQKQAEEVLSSRGLSVRDCEYEHADTYFAMLPGCSHLLPRARVLTVSDENAADVIIPFGNWKGSPRAKMLFRTPEMDPIPFDPFSEELNAWNALVVGATGSGKSVLLNLLLASHLSSGGAAVVIDVGGSYRRLTEFFGGTYLDVGQVATTGLNPLPAPATLHAVNIETRDLHLQFIGDFFEMLLSQTGSLTDNERAVVAKALSAFYDPSSVRAGSFAIPTLPEMQTWFSEFPGIDKQIARSLAQRLDLWTHGPKARLLSAPLSLDLSPSIVAVDLKALEEQGELKALALFVISYVIWQKLSTAERKRSTIIEFDECWDFINHPVGARLIERFVRTLRKERAGLWCVSQSVEDFAGASIANALLENCHTRIMLQALPGTHQRVGEVFKLSEHSMRAYESLAPKKGQYSEAFFQMLTRSGEHAERFQIVPSALAYWMATTDATDRALEAKIVAENPDKSLIKIIQALAHSYPHGAAAARAKSSKGVSYA